MSARLSLLLVLAACGSSSKTTEQPQPRVWKDMNADQRMKYMQDVVLPKSKEIFVAFDAKYATMDCKTCHGPGADDGSFEMPSTGIKPLPATPEAFMEWIGKDASAARYTEFMAKKVEPLMGELLQKTVFNPETKTGELSCGNCHTLVDAEGKTVHHN